MSRRQHKPKKRGAVVDYTSRNVILLPVARRALRGAESRLSSADRKAANEAAATNSLLATLPHADYQRLLLGLEPVTLKFGQVLHEPGVPIRHVYFPVDCVISLVTIVESHPPLQVGLIGHEGMVGISVALGIEVPTARALVQGTGTAMRMETTPFRKNVLQSKPLEQALYRYKHALTGQIAQSAVCNQFHSLQARLARYLLMTSDRARSSEFRLTQKFLADMLGVRRASVTDAALILQKRMLVKYSRGDITLLDRRRLIAVACGCYQIVEDMYDCARPGALVLNEIAAGRTRTRAARASAIP